MVPLLSKLTVLSAFANVLANPSSSNTYPNAAKACVELRKRVPDIVHLPGSNEYVQDIDHWLPVSTQNSTCSVAPRTAEDVQETIKIIGRDDIRSPFAIKSGGHAFNPTFSSTPGVEVSLHNLLDFAYNPEQQTVEFGSGWIWDDLYEKLLPYNVTVVGGRVPGIGMGLLLGGGFSWYTNQHGLASDNAVSFDLVLPNGTFVEVTRETQPDLFFGLSGGGNNFGIVAGATVKTWPSGAVRGGTISYSIEYNEEVMKAVEQFSVENKDEKAQLEAIYTVTNNETLWRVLFFYDGPDTSPAPFSAFLQIPSTGDTTKITTHAQLVKDSIFPPPTGAYLHTVPILHYTIPVLRAVEVSVSKAYAKALKDGRSPETLYWFAEPFYNHFSHTSFPSAYPHSSSNPVTPSCFGFNYGSAEDVEYFKGLIEDVAKEVQQVVVQEEEGRWDDVKYPNYAVVGTDLRDVYGESLEGMRRVKESIDLDNVMGLLTGGFLV